MWYYASHGQQQGPFDDATLDQLIASGTVTSDTMVWKDGMEEWTPLKRARSQRSTGVPPEDATSSTCSMCGKNAGADNLIDLLGHRVCADCKPLAVQSLREGAKPVGSQTAWRDGANVVTYDKNSLPPRCCKCNQAVSGQPLSRKLYWHPAAYYLLIFVHLFIYVIVAICVRKRASVDVYLCGEHIRRRKRFAIGGWAGAILGIALFIAGISNNVSWWTWSGVALFGLSIIGGLWGSSLVRAVRIKDNTVWLKGAGPQFLASLPPWA